MLKDTLDDGLRRGTERARTAIVPLGVLYHLTGDEKYGEACERAVLQHGSFGSYAALGLYGYDLVYDLMTPEQRRSCEDQSAAVLRANRWRQRARLMHAVGMFDRQGALTTDGFGGSGADWHEPLRELIESDDVVVVSPHKVYGPESNDLSLQLRKRGIDKIILAGMSANLCVEAHLRELTEQGFEVCVVKDATAGAQLPGGDFYQAAILNFRMIASSVQTTDQITQSMKEA